MVMQPFPWYGSKVQKQKFIQPKLPDTKRFVVPFGGSGAILLNRETSGLECFNDIDEGVMNFFEVLRDNSTELVENLQHTPYHEEVFEKSKTILNEGGTDMEKAIAFFVRTTMAYNSGSDSFAYSTKEIRRDRSQHTSRFQTKITELEAVADRLHQVQFLCRDARKVIETFDKDDTLQYWDPPYPASVRNGTGSYNTELTTQDHKELLELANESTARIAISSYSNELYNNELEGWFRYDDEKRGTGATNDGSKRMECLYTNYKVNGETDYIHLGDYEAKCENCVEEVEDEPNTQREIVESELGVLYCNDCAKKLIMDKL